MVGTHMISLLLLFCSALGDIVELVVLDTGNSVGLVVVDSISNSVRDTVELVFGDFSSLVEDVVVDSIVTSSHSHASQHSSSVPNRYMGRLRSINMKGSGLPSHIQEEVVEWTSG